MSAAIWFLALVLSASGCAVTAAPATPTPPPAIAGAAPGPPATSIAARDDWRVYGGDLANTKYSPLAQIHRDNFATLEIAWRWRSADHEVLDANPDVRTGRYETTPLMVDGVLYASTSLSQVAAIDARTGTTLWVYDPKTSQGRTPPNLGFIHRGVAYWADGPDRRILIGTGDGYLIALDAATGKPVPSFGREGRIDLVSGLRRAGPFREVFGVTSPPIVCRDVVVVGASIVDFAFKELPPGDIHGFDVRTGKLRWVFHAVPEAGELGVETWEHGSWQRTGNTNVWSIMSCDERLGYLYLPFSTPSNDYYGGDRHGDNLFAESLVALEATTGRRAWHQQLVHHGLWDYDLPAPPNVVTIRRGAQRIDAVVAPTKQGFLFVFDRASGTPLWPVEERAVPQSDVAGEASWPTQPFPTKPAPVAQQGFTDADVIDFTPEVHNAALALVRKYRMGPLYTPPSMSGTIVMPGVIGGVGWGGAAYDPETSTLFVKASNTPAFMRLEKRAAPSDTVDAEYMLDLPNSSLSVRLPSAPGEAGGERVSELPINKPPYGTLTAIDLATGEFRWQVSIGDSPEIRNHPALRGVTLPPLGVSGSPGAMVTAGGLVFATGGGSFLYALDTRDGRTRWQFDLGQRAYANPMTYRTRSGTQFVVIATGGGAGAVLRAFSLGH